MSASPAAATAPNAAAESVPTLRELGGGRLAVSGALVFATATALRALGRQTFSGSTGAIELDLSAVGRADSAGLALLIDWLAWARQAGRTMKFSGIPAALLALARLSDVEAVVVEGV